MSRNVILIAAIVILAGYLYMKTEDQQKQVVEMDTTQQEMSAQIDAPEVADAGDSVDTDLIENLYKDGIISKIDIEGDSPKVYVTADYYRIAEVDKTAIMEVLLKKFSSNNPAVTSFGVYDAKSGDMVGTYSNDGFKDN